MKIIHYHLNRAMAEYRRELKEAGHYIRDLWDAKWIILKNIEYWTTKDHQIMKVLLNRYSGTVIEDILIFKQRVRELFLDSKNSDQAYISREDLIKNGWHLRNKHSANIIEF